MIRNRGLRTCRSSFSRAHLLLTTGAALLVLCPSAFGDNATWDGSEDGQWSNIDNWAGPPATVPGTGDTATFNGAGGGNTTIDLGLSGGTQTVRRILVSGASAAAYTFGENSLGEDTLTFSSPITHNVDIRGTVTTKQKLVADVILGDGSAGTYSWDNDGAETFTFDGNVDHGTGALTPGNVTLRVRGSGGGTIWNGSASDTGDALRFDFETRDSGGVTVSSTGSLVGFDRERVLQNGSITVEAGGQLDGRVVQLQAGTITVNSDQTINNLDFGGGNASSGRDANLVINSGVVRQGSTWEYFDDNNTPGDASVATISGAGSVMLTANRNWNIDDNVNVAGPEMTVSVDITSDNGNRDFNKQDLGRLDLTGTISGLNLINVQSGELRAKNLGLDNDLLLGNNNTEGTFVYTGVGEQVSEDTQIRVGDNDNGTGGGKLLNEGTGTLEFLRTGVLNEARGNATQDRNFTVGGTSDIIFQGRLVDNNATNAKISVIKEGDGTVQILGPGSSIGGDVTVSGGRLDLSGTVGGALNVADGAAIGGTATYGGPATFGTTGPVDLFVDGDRPGGITVSGASTDTSNGVVVKSDQAIGGFGNFTVLDYDQTQVNNITPLAADFSTGLGISGSGRVGAASFTDDGDVISLNLGYADNVWVGGDAFNPTHWDINTTANWNNGTDSVYFDGDSVTFEDSVGNGGSSQSLLVELQSNVAPGRIVFNNEADTVEIRSAGTEKLTVGEYGLTVNGDADVRIRSELIGSGDITKGDADGNNDNEQLFLHGNNQNFTGKTYILDGDIQIEHVNALGNDASNTVFLIDQGDDPRLIISAQGTFANDVDASGTGGNKWIRFDDGGNSGNRALTMTGEITMRETGSTLAFDVEGRNESIGSTHRLTVNGKITSAYPHADGPITKTDQGTLILGNGGNDFTGALYVNSGTVRVESIGNIGEASHAGAARSQLPFHIRLGNGGTDNTPIHNSGTLIYTGAGSESSDRIFRIGASNGNQGAPGSNGGGTIANNGGGGLHFTNAVFNSPENTSANRIGARTLTLAGTYTGENQIDGVISDNYAGGDFVDETISVRVDTDGTWILNGNNTYTGDTIVANGTLVVNGSIASSGNTIVETGAILEGIGTLGATVYQAGAIVSPGNSIGTLNQGNTTWNGLTTYQFEFQTDGTGAAGTDWDVLNITGVLDLSGASSGSPITIELITMENATDPGFLGSWDELTDHSWAGIVQTSGGITGFSPSQFIFDDTGFQNAQNPPLSRFSIVRNGNNLDLIYTAVPEPGTSGILLLLVSGLGLWRKRRKLAVSK